MTTGQTIARALNELTAAWSAEEEQACAELIDKMVPPEKSLFECETAKPVKPLREQDLLFESLCGVCGIRWQEMTKAARGRVNGPLAQLREVGATPQEIRRRALAFVRLYPSIRPTPATIAARWPELGANTAITGDFRPEMPVAPAGWSNWLESAYPGNSYGPNGATPCSDWQRLPNHVRDLILRECPQARRAAG